jgi:hypothetical protein
MLSDPVLRDKNDPALLLDALEAVEGDGSRSGTKTPFPALAPRPVS